MMSSSNYNSYILVIYRFSNACSPELMHRLALVSMPSNAFPLICCCKLLQAWTIAASSSLRVWGCWLRGTSHIFCFRYSHRKKPQTARSGERGDHGQSPRLDMTLPGNWPLSYWSVTLLVWAGVPSCCHHITCLLMLFLGKSLLLHGNV